MILEMLENGEYKKKKWSKRPKPKMIESVVDKSNFLPNVNDARNLLDSAKKTPTTIGLYDFEHGETKGVGHTYMRNNLDITEIDKMQEVIKKEVDKNLKNALQKGKKEMDKMQENEKAETPNVSKNTIQNSVEN